MPRVLTKKKSNAGKAVKCGKCGTPIKPGETYYRWSFRYGGTRYACSKHYPKRSELTQSKMGTIYDAQEGAEADIDAATTIEDIENAVRNVGEQTQEVIDEYRDAAESFGGGGPNGEAADDLEGWQSDLESWSPENEDLDEVKVDALSIVGECPR